MAEKTLYDVLHDIQQKLKAPKNQRNNFGKYDYRSCEDILEAVKPLLPAGICVIVSDEVVSIGERYYIKATASIQDSSMIIKVDGFAREAESQKGMVESQLTGATSSYARKYALNGLFCIDDNKDADSTNKHETKQQPQKPAPSGLRESDVGSKKAEAKATLLRFASQDKTALNKITGNETGVLGALDNAFHDYGLESEDFKNLRKSGNSVIERYESIKQFIKENVK